MFLGKKLNLVQECLYCNNIDNKKDHGYQIQCYIGKKKGIKYLKFLQFKVIRKVGEDEPG